MIRNSLVVAALLLALVQTSAAAQEPEHKSKNARKVELLLGMFGVNNKQAKEFVSEIDARSENGYFRLAEERVGGGTLVLHYELSGGVRAKQVELRFTPDNSNWQATARTTGMMVSYKIQF